MSRLSDLHKADVIAAFLHIDATREVANPLTAMGDLNSLYGWNRAERSRVMLAWTNTFDEGKTARDRVDAALEDERVANES